jgi:VIT1/CCC1 family predicted Fe2+/Mn2+ transporter
MNEGNATNYTRNLAEMVREIREELKQFLNTRVEMLRSEMHEILAAIRIALPLGALALILLGTGFLLLTGAAVTIVASAFAGSAYAWFYAFIIVGFVWIATGGIAGFFAFNEFRSRAIFPKRTVEVLKADKNWIESEARTHYGRAA